MFDTSKLENKSMIDTFVFVQNKTETKINGVSPGQVIRVPIWGSGVPRDPYWRKMYKGREVNLSFRFSSPNDISEKKHEKETESGEKKAAKVKPKSTKKEHNHG